MLEDQFRNVQGYKMVQDKEYVIQDPSTRRDIDQSLPWETSVLPGQKVVMSMLFKEESSSTTSCPKCQTSSKEQQTSDVLCAGCGIWYRRITEYNDVDPDIPIANANEQIYVNEKSMDVDPQISDNPENLPRCREPRLGHLNHDDITRFKRVRVLSINSRNREAELVD